MEISLEQYNKMAERLTELEYREAERQWIPVTLDLPPCCMPVLTWDGKTRHVEQRIPYVRDENGEKIISDWWIDGDEKWDEWAEYQPNLRDGCAIKWMPLPEPCEGGQDENN